MIKQTFTTAANIKARRNRNCDELGICQGVCDGQNCFGPSKRESAGNYHPQLQKDTVQPWAGLSEWAGKLAYKASIGVLIVISFGGAAGYVLGRWPA